MSRTAIFLLTSLLLQLGCKGSNQAVILPTIEEAKRQAAMPLDKLTTLKPPVPGKSGSP